MNKKSHRSLVIDACLNLIDQLDEQHTRLGAATSIYIETVIEEGRTLEEAVGVLTRTWEILDEIGDLK